MMEPEKITPADEAACHCGTADPLGSTHPPRCATADDPAAAERAATSAWARCARPLQEIALGLCTTVVVCLAVACAAPLLREMVWFFPPVKSALPTTQTDCTPAAYRTQVKRVNALQQRLGRLTPREAYLIVNTFNNEILLKRGEDTLRTGFCSTGSSVLLKSADAKKWVFATPRGMYRVQGKVESPVWRRPDWSFVEEGRPIPPADSPERYQRGVLGDYALSLGQGYMIHGTLYKRFIGLPVTHGCIRLGDEDLEVVYHNLQIGSKVYIY